MNRIAFLKLKIARARYNIIFMVVLSALNIIFIASGNTAYMPFSSAISSYATAIGIKAANENNDATYRILGFAIAFIILIAFVYCYLKSKQKIAYFIVAFTLLAADSITLIVFSVTTGTLSQLFNILDILLHVLTLVYIFNAIKAHIELEKLPEFADSNAAVIIGEGNFGAEHNEPEDIDDTEIEDCETNVADDEDMTKPIRAFSNENYEPLLSGNINNLDVFVTIDNNVAILVINGYVCDELNVVYNDEYQLRAIVNDIDFVFEYKRSQNGEAMYLYADDELLDSLGRN